MKCLLPPPVLSALDRLEEAGYAAYVVGGCVRDWALGITPHDYDICTAASPEEMKRVFAGFRCVETGIRHGTLTVLTGDMPLEITAFRVDGAYMDGRHPDSVRFTDRVEEDLARRDFTVNAMAYSPRRGLADPFHGREDCKRGLIRCVGEPEQRFLEDALRILRALRFSARLSFPIEKNTALALRALRGHLDLISRERIAMELTGLLQGKDAGRVMAAFPEVIAQALPETETLTKSEAWPLTLRRVGRAPLEETVRWAALLLNVGKEKADGAVRSLKMSARDTEEIGKLIAWSGQAVSPANAQEMLMHLGPETLGRLIGLQAADALARGEDEKETDRREIAAREKTEALIRENACYTLGQLAVGGRDMAALGLRGPAIGDALKALLLSVVRGETPNEREALLKAAGRIG